MPRLAWEQVNTDWWEMPVPEDSGHFVREAVRSLRACNITFDAGPVTLRMFSHLERRWVDLEIYPTFTDGFPWIDMRELIKKKELITEIIREHWAGGHGGSVGLGLGGNPCFEIMLSAAPQPCNLKPYGSEQLSKEELAAEMQKIAELVGQTRHKYPDLSKILGGYKIHELTPVDQGATRARRRRDRTFPRGLPGTPW